MHYDYTTFVCLFVTELYCHGDKYECKNFTYVTIMICNSQDNNYTLHFFKVEITCMPESTFVIRDNNKTKA